MVLKIDMQVSPQERELHDLKKRLKQLEDKYAETARELNDMKQALKAKKLL